MSNTKKISHILRKSTHLTTQKSSDKTRKDESSSRKTRSGQQNLVASASRTTRRKNILEEHSYKVNYSMSMLNKCIDKQRSTVLESKVKERNPSVGKSVVAETRKKQKKNISEMSLHNVRNKKNYTKFNMSPTGEIKRLLDNSLKSEIGSTYHKKDTSKLIEYKQRRKITSMNTYEIEKIEKAVLKAEISDQKISANTLENKPKSNIEEKTSNKEGLLLESCNSNDKNNNLQDADSTYNLNIEKSIIVQEKSTKNIDNKNDKNSIYDNVLKKMNSHLGKHATNDQKSKTNKNQKIPYRTSNVRENSSFICSQKNLQIVTPIHTHQKISQNMKKQISTMSHEVQKLIVKANPNLQKSPEYKLTKAPVIDLQASTTKLISHSEYSPKKQLPRTKSKKNIVKNKCLYNKESYIKQNLKANLENRKQSLLQKEDNTSCKVEYHTPRNEILSHELKRKDVPTKQHFFPVEMDNKTCVDGMSDVGGVALSQTSETNKVLCNGSFVRKLQKKIEDQTSKQTYIIKTPQIKLDPICKKKSTCAITYRCKQKELVIQKDLFNKPKVHPSSTKNNDIQSNLFSPVTTRKLNTLIMSSKPDMRLTEKPKRKDTTLTLNTNFNDYCDKFSDESKKELDENTHQKTESTVANEHCKDIFCKESDINKEKEFGKHKTSMNKKDIDKKKDYDFNHMFKIINFLENDKDLQNKRQELRQKLKHLKHQTENTHQNVENTNFTALNTLFSPDDFTSNRQCDLDEYNIIKNLGQGSYAVVKLGTHKKTNMKVAMKIYEKVKLQDYDKMKNVKNEIENLRYLSHENIIKLFKSIHTVKQIYLIMEFIGSSSLYDYTCLRDKFRIEEMDCRSIFRQVCKAICYIHSKDIVHRDIKMENIQINKSNQVKLIDFGFSINTAPDEKLTVFCGTPSYMAPEIVSKRPHYGKPADVWAQGVLLYKLQTGQFPFKGRNDKDLFSSIQIGRYDSPKFQSLEVKSIIRSMLKVSPTERINCEQIVQHPWFYDGLNSDEKDSASDSFFS